VESAGTNSDRYARVDADLSVMSVIFPYIIILLWRYALVVVHARNDDDE